MSSSFSSCSLFRFATRCSSKELVLTADLARAARTVIKSSDCGVGGGGGSGVGGNGAGVGGSGGLVLVACISLSWLSISMAIIDEIIEAGAISGVDGDDRPLIEVAILFKAPASVPRCDDIPALLRFGFELAVLNCSLRFVLTRSGTRSGNSNRLAVFD